MITRILPQLNAAAPIVDDSGNMTQYFRSWATAVTASVPIVGEGSPEGVVQALEFSFYIDSLGTTGFILWCKMLPDVGGDVLQGWVLI